MQISEVHFKILGRQTLIIKWLRFEDKAKFEKNGLVSLGPKRLCKESLEDLEFSSN